MRGVLRTCALLGFAIGIGCVEHKNVAGREGRETVPTSTPRTPPSAAAALSAPPSADAVPAPSVLAATDAALASPFVREEWEVVAGHWEFEETGELACECKTNSSLVYRKGAQPKNFDASFDVMFFGVESSAGLVFREVGDDFYNEATFYQFEWYTAGTHHDKRLSLMTKQFVSGASGKRGPFWIQIVEPRYPTAPYDKWTRFRVRADGDQLKTWIDGELQFEKRDPTFVREGKIGLHVFQPRKVRFRDFRLQPL